MAAQVMREIVIPAERASCFSLSFPLYSCETGEQGGLDGQVVVLILRAVDAVTPKLVIRSDDSPPGTATLVIEDPGSATEDVRCRVHIGQETFVNADAGRYETEIAVTSGSELLVGATRTPTRIITSAVVE